MGRPERGVRGLWSLIAVVTALALASSTTACSIETAGDGAEDGDPSGSSEAAATETVFAAADPAATPATKTVLANLHSFDMGSTNAFDRRILIGQQEADVSNRTASGLTRLTSDIQNLTGKTAAVVGYELSHVDKGALTMFDAAAFRAGAPALRARILEQHARGALVTLVWHMRCPKAANNVPDTFGGSDCPRDYRLEELLERKNDGARGAHFVAWRAMLDELSELLWSLKDARGQLIPVQIRPFHEFTGEWFWWGRANPPAIYGAVWREMVTYIREGRGLHNALWVFCPASPSDTGSFTSFYPGDAYVDVVAFDRYDFGNGRFASGYEADLRTVGTFARVHHKVAAVGEVGTDLGRRGNADPTWFTRTMLAPLKASGRSFAYVTVWRNAPWEKFVPEPGDGPIADDFRAMARDGAALFSGQHDLYTPLHVPPSS